MLKKTNMVTTFMLPSKNTSLNVISTYERMADRESISAVR